MEVFLALDIPPFVMYCVNGKPRSSLFIESTDSMIDSAGIEQTRKLASLAIIIIESVDSISRDEPDSP